MSIRSIVFIGLPAAGLAVAGFGSALVRLEETSPFSQKPSVLLRVWGGDLPASRLPETLEEVTAQLEAVKAAKRQAQAAAKAHREVEQEIKSHLQQLEERVAEKQASQWSVPAQ